jgi:hypothetical protein
MDNDSSDAYLVWAGGVASDRGPSDFDVRQAFTASISYQARFFHGATIDAIFHARTGFPITPLQREDYRGIPLVNAFRPNLQVNTSLWMEDRSAPGGKRLNPAAFLPTAQGVQGILGRNALGGFGMSQFDLAVSREFRRKESVRILLRIEAFNAFNHANFGDPVKFLNSPLFGQSVSMLNMMLGTGTPGSGLAPGLQTGGPRALQGSIRFEF